MSFKETYRSEVLQSRRDRSRRAFFWGRILGLALMLTIGAILRSEPELRRALAGAGMDAIMAVAGARQAPQQVAQATQSPTSLPKSRIKVNRFGDPDDASPASPDAQSVADDLGRSLAAQRPVE
ncbi:hypothetical protein [Sulfitobacter sp. SK011]|uniref:hypothetical protein n=1 Tax=Sulfitobacter sp. SK011 TaxID=1389004 RepID=UPI000E0C2B25|nr:hypothetical protein [Sulfitobacter sp. SK011]AXI41262.1 hypothetical protein C1J02_04250 [Sulfitobacter sp. SK011]